MKRLHVRPHPGRPLPRRRIAAHRQVHRRLRSPIVDADPSPGGGPMRMRGTEASGTVGDPGLRFGRTARPPAGCGRWSSPSTAGWLSRPSCSNCRQVNIIFPWRPCILPTRPAGCMKWANGIRNVRKDSMPSRISCWPAASCPTWTRAKPVPRRARRCCAPTVPPTWMPWPRRRRTRELPGRWIPDTQMNPHSYRGGAACRGRGRAGGRRGSWRGEAPTAFCAVRPPGHHACRDQRNGFLPVQQRGDRRTSRHGAGTAWSAWPSWTSTCTTAMARKTSSPAMRAS